MHPEVITDHPGNCPKCGMKLVPIKPRERGTPNSDKSRAGVQRSTSKIEHRTSNIVQPETHSSHMSHPSDATHHGEMEMSMHSTIDLADPMSREGSGTSWIPDSSPMYGRMFMFGDDMLMLHGAIFPRYTNVSTATRRRSDRCAELVHGDVFPSARRLDAVRLAFNDEPRSAHRRRPRLSAAVSKR